MAEAAIAFVNALDLDDQVPHELLAHTEKPTGFLDNNHLVSFVGDLTGTNRQDVLDSTLLASLAANKAANKQTDPVAWYEKYTNVMAMVGWDIQSFNFDKFDSSSASLSINGMVLDILKDLITPEQLLTVEKMMNALKDTSQPWYEMFKTTSSSDHTGAFLVAPCKLDRGNVMIGLGAFHFQTKVSATNIFFAEYKSTDISFYKSAQALTLNEDAYSTVRQTVSTKLGERKNQVKNLDI